MPTIKDVIESLKAAAAEFGEDAEITEMEFDDDGDIVFSFD